MPDRGTGPAPDWDVIVVGAGPGGAAAAKRCAETGLRTLVLEKRAWPRDKVCSGMIMGPWAHDIIRDHFGAIPREVLASLPVLKGHFFHVPGAAPAVLEWPTPLAWRKNLDAWLLQKACAAGAEVRTQARVTQVESHGQIIRLTLNGPDGDEPLSARWVIGADGANSDIRKVLFPGLKTSYSTPIRECYPGSLRLDQNYFHWFFPKGRPRPRFNVNHKDGFFLIEGSGIRELRADISRILADHWFDPSQKPIWRDGCLIPKLHQNLIESWPRKESSRLPGQEGRPPVLIWNCCGRSWPRLPYSFSNRTPSPNPPPRLPWAVTSKTLTKKPCGFPEPISY
ncbi:MAG: FAD-dependent monooxygenase [Desulfobacterota bacterium]|nr:FAD-dependent monooxygenase [Thermodesulfobacteriota bacterium]